MVKLSRVTKLDGIRSWSLEAGQTCPGSYKLDGTLVDACSGCYAKAGNYRFSNVKAPRQHNRQDWKRDDWEQDMIQELDNDRYFRWFDSGDIYHPKLAEKIYNICQATPWVKHWIPTRSYKIPKIKAILEQLNELPNVVVRYSSDSITGEYKNHHGSTIVPTPDWNDSNIHICQAYLHGKCNKCRSCWDKSVKTVGYVAHGRSMTAKLKKLDIITK